VQEELAMRRQPNHFTVEKKKRKPGAEPQYRELGTPPAKPAAVEVTGAAPLLTVADRVVGTIHALRGSRPA
jgi:hypothetical protein